MDMKTAKLSRAVLALGLLTVIPAVDAAPIQLSSCQGIFSSGAYIVTQNLANPSGDCLLLESDRVTIDLNGFSVSAAGRGIRTVESPGTWRHLVIRNGSVSGGTGGIILSSSETTTVEGVRATGGTDWAILVPNESVVKDCLVTGGAKGISAAGLVVGNIVSGTTGTGMAASGTVKDNVVADNGGDGLVTGGVVMGNTVTGNGGHGIVVSCPSVLVGNTASGNGGDDMALSGQGCTRAHNVPHP